MVVYRLCGCGGGVGGSKSVATMMIYISRKGLLNRVCRAFHIFIFSLILTYPGRSQLLLEAIFQTDPV